MIEIPIIKENHEDEAPIGYLVLTPEAHNRLYNDSENGLAHVLCPTLNLTTEKIQKIYFKFVGTIPMLRQLNPLKEEEIDA